MRKATLLAVLLCGVSTAYADSFEDMFTTMEVEQDYRHQELMRKLDELGGARTYYTPQDFAPQPQPQPRHHYWYDMTGGQHDCAYDHGFLGLGGLACR